MTHEESEYVLKLEEENIDLRDQITQLNREIKAMKEEMIKVRSTFYTKPSNVCIITGAKLNNTTL